MEESLAGFLPVWQTAWMTDLRAWRKKLGLTQRDLAEALGITNSAVTKYENGSQRPRPELARRIEAYTKGEVSAASLLGVAQSSKRSQTLQEEAAGFGAAEVISVEIPVSPQQRQDLVDSGIDIMSIARAGAQKALAEAHSKAWREANREAIDAYNAWIEKHGTLAEQLGLI